MKCKRTLSLFLSLLMLLSLFSGLPALAAAPDAIPSQISLSLAGGAGQGRVAMAFSWVTDTTVSTSKILYSTDRGAVENGTASSKAAGDPVVFSADDIPLTGRAQFKPVHGFKAVVTDLVPGEVYYYKLGNDSAGYSEIASFTARDASSDEPFSVLFIPDTQGTSVSSFANTRELTEYLMENEPDAAFMIHAGDIVNDANISDQWQWFYDAAQSLLSMMPFMATPGNHDSNIYDPKQVQYRTRLDYSSLRTPDGLSDDAAGTVCAFDYGDALFICLNSYPSSYNEDWAVQWAFLADECAKTAKSWKIVYYHEATYDPGNSHYQLDNESGKRLSDAGVDLVLNGHEHAYARSTLLTTGTAKNDVSAVTRMAPGQAPTYVVGGSVYDYAYGKAELDTSWNEVFVDLRKNPSSGSSSIHAPGVYSKIDITRNSLSFKAYYKAFGPDKGFQVIDSFSITKPDSEIKQPVGGGQAPGGATFLFDSFDQPEGRFIARFNWTTDVSVTASELYYAKKSDFEANGGKFTNYVLGRGDRVDLLPDLINAGYTGMGTEYNVDPRQSHKAETATLEPDTEYVYCVGDGYRNVTSLDSPAVFKTPAADVDSFNFIFFTDMQQGVFSTYEQTCDAYRNEGYKILSRALSDYPDAAFILSGGDQINYAMDTWSWDAFFDANEEIFSTNPLYLAEGNHEHEGSGNAWAPGGSWESVDPTMRNLLGRYNPPANGAAYYGAGGNGEERMATGSDQKQFEAENYYFIYGDTLFLVMEYSDLSTPERMEVQQNWMRSVVKKNPDVKWRVAVIHKSMFGYRMSSPTASWTKAFDDAGVDLVLMGHDHIYVRMDPYANGASLAPDAYGEGTVYVTGFSSNDDRRGDYSPRQNKTDSAAFVEYRNLSGYLNISVTPEELRITAVGNDEAGDWYVSENNALLTNTPRTPSLEQYDFPEVPADVDTTISSVRVDGLAMEGQSLRAAYEPAIATVAISWERSGDGLDGWEAIPYATASVYTIKAADVGKYLRCKVSGTGFYHGSFAVSAAIKIKGMEEPGDVIEISSSAELLALSAEFGSSDFPMNGHYLLTADIDMTGIPFAPIGGDAKPFLGTFNGAGHTIGNLSISGTASRTGLFAYVGETGRIANLWLTDVNIGGGTSTGAIAGALTGVIESCAVSGVISGGSYTGGIAGAVHAGVIRNCLADVDVKGSSGVGGLYGGTSYGNVPGISRNEAEGNVTVNNLVTGTVGDSGRSTYAGGLIGDIAGGQGCYNQTLTGNVVNVTAVSGTGNIGCAYGYWSSSSSASIIDQGYVNYYSSLITMNIPGNDQSRYGAFKEKEPAGFALRETFEAIGWDFDAKWIWNADAGRPEPRVIEVETPQSEYVIIVASVEGNGSITPSGNIAVKRGESQSFVFTPARYNGIASVLINGVENAQAAQDGSYTFTDVQKLSTIHVVFEVTEIPEGRSPRVKSRYVHYDRSAYEHFYLNVDLGAGDAGVDMSGSGGNNYGFASVTAQKDGGVVFDFQGCIWYADKTLPTDDQMLEICWDDMVKKVEAYQALVPGTYDFVVVFNDALLTTFVIPFYVTNGEPPPIPADEAEHWTLSDLERAEKVSVKPDGAQTDSALYGLKGETVGYQIVVKAPLDQDLVINGLTVSDLAGGGSVVSAGNMTMYREHFIFVAAGNHSESYGGHNTFPSVDCWYPDALIPFTDPLTGKNPAEGGAVNFAAIPYTLPAGENAVFFVDVSIPEDAQAGDYAGGYTVSTSAGELSGGVALTVWDYAMRPGTQYSQFGGTGTVEANLRMLLDHGIGTNSTLSKELFDRLAPGQLFNNAGFWGNVSWGEPAYKMTDAPSVEEVAAAITKAGFTVGDGTMWVNYAIDEIETAYEEYVPEDWLDWFDPADFDPDYQGDPREFYYGSRELFRQKLYEWRKALNANGVSLLVVTRPYYDMLDDYDLFNADPDNADWIAKNGPKKPGEGEPLIDIFVSLDSLYSVPYRNRDGSVVLSGITGEPLTVKETVAAAQAKGCQVWSYTALVQDENSPTWSLDAPLADYRMLPGFLNQAMHFTGTLNWRVNYDTSRLTSSWKLDGAHYLGSSLLDGTLVYPGTGAGLSGGQYVSSLRLKAIRGGFADYAYAQMLRDEGEGAFVDGIVASVAVDYDNWTDSPEAILAAKKALGEKLDMLGKTAVAADYWTLDVLQRASSPDKKMAMPDDASHDRALYGLKGETVSYQIVLQAPEKGTTITGLTMSDFVSGDNTISASAFDFYREHFIFVPANHHTRQRGSVTDPSKVPDTGDMWYPDALIPFLDKQTGLPPADIEGTAGIKYRALDYAVPAGENAAYWIDVNIPSDARPGDYTATYTMETDKGTLTGTVTLRVWNYEMPAESSLYTNISLKPGGVYYGDNEDYGTDYFNQLGTVSELLRNRFNIADPLMFDNDYTVVADPNEFREIFINGQRYIDAGFWAESWWGVCDMLAVDEEGKDFRLVYRYGDELLSGPEIVARRAADIRAAYGDDVRIVTYLVDEIEDAYTGNLSKGAGPDDTGYDFYNTDPKKAHDILRKKLYDWHEVLSANGIELLAVTKPFKDMIDTSDIEGSDGGPLIDIFVTKGDLWPAVYDMDEGMSVDQIMDWARANGTPIEVWTYTALYCPGTPTWELDFNLLHYRISQGFINQSLGATGYLHWTSNCWTIDPWTSARHDWNTSVIGDGVLLYPGDQAGISYAVPTLRLKSARDGVYDYEYIQMLRDAGYGDWAMSVVGGVAKDFYDWNGDPRALLNARMALGEKLNEIGSTPAAAVKTVSVTTPTLVELLAANLRIRVTGDNLEGKTLTAYFKAGDELLYPTALTFENGVWTALMRVETAPDYTVDCSVVVKVNDGDIQGDCKITLAEYKPAQLWYPTVTATEDGKIKIEFSELITLKAGYTVTVDGVARKAAIGDRELILEADYSALSQDSTIIVSGLKYPVLFPSYSFTFTLKP